MSRIGNAIILIPAGVTIEMTGNHIVASGSKGKLEMDFPVEIKVAVTDSDVKVSRKSDQKKSRALHGLIRSLIANMVKGVSEGWTKNLELVGVGFRVQGGGDKLTLNVGYSHPVDIQAPEGISFEVRDNTKITVSGIDKGLVGQTSAKIKAVRPPEPYKGKGIRYEGEYVRRKAGKAGKVGAK
jgi:large subunit ribosomal protein L6